MFFLDHIWLIPLLPAFGAALMFFFGRKLQKQTVSAVCVGVVALAFVFACGAVWQYTGYAHDNPGKPFEKIVYTWLGTDTGHMNLRHARRHSGRRSRPTPASCSIRSPPSGCCSSPASACSSIFIPPATWRTRAGTTASSDI